MTEASIDEAGRLDGPDMKFEEDEVKSEREFHDDGSNIYHDMFTNDDATTIATGIYMIPQIPQAQMRRPCS